MWRRLRKLFGNTGEDRVVESQPLAMPDIERLLAAGIAKHGEGNLGAAAEIYRKVLADAPSHPGALHFMGIVLAQQGDYDGAEPMLRDAVRLDDGNPVFLANLGNVVSAQGRLREAIDVYRRSIEIESLPEAHYGIGNVLLEMQNIDEAEASYERAIALRPGYAEAHYNLGRVFRAQGKLEEAIACYREALALRPANADAHNSLGEALYVAGMLEEAAATYRQALMLQPDNIAAHNDLGMVLENLGRFDEAIACYRRALSLKPDFAETHYNMGHTLNALGRRSESIAAYRRAIKLKPDFAVAYYNLAHGLQSQGWLEDAISSYREALRLKPDFTDAHTNLIFSLDMVHSEDTLSLQAERRKWDAAHAAHLRRSWPHPNARVAERQLRIGYVSGDFKRHSAATVFGPMLTHFDPEHFEVFAYSNSAEDDWRTREFRQNVSHWRDIFGASDDAVAELIREDEIDILVDLSGYSGGNRLLVFARKPAPIQVTAWGYAASTGIKAMDVFFADPVIVPPEEKPLYTEEVRYLPCIVGYSSPCGFSEVNALPALTAAGITFGSFNRAVKMTDAAFRVWTRILSAIPDSRMIIKAFDLDEQVMQGRVTRHCREAGIDGERILLLGKTSWEDHVAAFNRIDIALDPFPHGGGVTALEGLMMGVPMVTLRYPTIAGRLSASILTTLGLTDWIAETEQEYVALAQRKALDLAELAQLRKELRGKFMASVLGDAQAYVRAAEVEYRQLWREWCARQGAERNADAAESA